MHITKVLRRFAVLMAVIFASNVSFAGGGTTEPSGEFNPTETIMHHIMDAHEFHIAGDLSMPLPIILFTENGLVTFMSSEFHHDDAGNVIVSKGGLNFVKMHETIYQLTDGATHVEFDAEHHPVNAMKPWSIFETHSSLYDFSITKNVFSMFLSVLLLILIFSASGRNYKKNKGAPKGIAGFVEPLVVFIRDEVAIPNIGEKKYQRFMPYLLTVFFFIWLNNLIGLVPFFPGSANLTGNIGFTATLAVLTFLVTTFSANKHYWAHIFWMPGVPVPIKIFLIPIELAGAISKPFALLIRLFANISAGHIIILSLISIIFIFKTVAISPVSIGFSLFMNVLELLVAALQAFVFTLLSALFIGSAVADHH